MGEGGSGQWKAEQGLCPANLSCYMNEASQVTLTISTHNISDLSTSHGVNFPRM